MKIFSVATIKGYSNTIGERNVVDEIMSTLLFVQRILGQNLLDPNWSWKNQFLKHTFIISLIIYVFFGTRDYLKDKTDIPSIGEAYYTVLITLIFVVKYSLILHNRKTFQTLYLIAKTTLLEMVKMDSIKKYEAMLNKIRLIVKMLFVTTNFPVAMYLFFAIWHYIIGNRVTLSKTTSILMPMTSPYYEIGFILHAIFLFEMGFSILVIDMWFVILIFFLCMAWNSTVDILKVEPKRHGELDSQYEERLNNSLRMFYKNHNQLMKYLNIFSNMQKWPAIVPLVSTLLSFCLMLFLMTEKVQWVVLSNILPTAIEIFAYNWFGEHVKDKGIQLNMALLNYDWQSMRMKDRKNYLIIITYMAKEICIKTAVGNDLSLFTMSSVVKASYQSFAVLKSMGE